jgi:hypothetical protein
MAKESMMTTSRASLCALGESLTRHGCFAPLREQVQSPQKTTFPRNKNAALPVKTQKPPLTRSGLKKMGPGWRLRPRAFAPQASVMAASVREDVGHEYTWFMRWGEDARLHGRFQRIMW